MSPRAETWAWLLQRVSAAILAPAVAVHLVLIIYAARQGFSASAILARTAGNPWWLGFYLLFTTAAALHAALGLRVILREMTPWRGLSLDGAAALAGVTLSLAGWRAAFGLFA